jgi:hypothetical protein
MNVTFISKESDERSNHHFRAAPAGRVVQVSGRAVGGMGAGSAVVPIR